MYASRAGVKEKVKGGQFTNAGFYFQLFNARVLYTLPVCDSTTKLLRFKELYSIATRRSNAPAFVFRVRDPRTKPLGLRVR